MKATIKRKIRKIISPFRKVGLHNTNFTILSNNCWGGFIYDYFGLPYATPTIGLYFSSDDFIKFVENIPYYLNCELLPCEGTEKCKVRGRLGDIYLNFVHYDSFEEALDKWNRRKQRVNFNNLLVKFNDQNDFHAINFQKFYDCKYKNKIFFTANKEYESDITIVFKNEKGPYIQDDIKTSLKYIDIKKILNELEKENDRNG